jgi:hypothetical protein
MADADRNALIPGPATDPIRTDRRASPVMVRMTKEILARAQASGLNRARFGMFGYQFRAPDYHQILDWAKALGTTPEEIVERLEDSSTETGFGGDPRSIAFAVDDGAMTSLVWDFERLPLVPTTWQQGLRLCAAGFVGRFGSAGRWADPPSALRPRLPDLKLLAVESCRLDPLDLTGVPQLRELLCFTNGLKKLDLSPVPGLTTLMCHANWLKALDLAPVQGLDTLRCGFNRLAELDLSPVRNLTVLDCAGNGFLSALDLGPVPRLSILRCSDNPITELDLSPVPQLTELFCSMNNLAKLDLSSVPQLTTLHCGANRLAALDLSPVPRLTRLDCTMNKLTELDLSPVKSLRYLSCDQDVVVRNAPPGLRIDHSGLPL